MNAESVRPSPRRRRADSSPSADPLPLVILPGIHGEPVTNLIGDQETMSNAFTAARAGTIIGYVRLGMTAEEIKTAIVKFDRGVRRTMHHLFSDKTGTNPALARIRAAGILLNATSAYKPLDSDH